MVRRNCTQRWQSPDGHSRGMEMQCATKANHSKVRRRHDSGKHSEAGAKQFLAEQRQSKAVQCIGMTQHFGEAQSNGEANRSEAKARQGRTKPGQSRERQCGARRSREVRSQVEQRQRSISKKGAI